MVRVVYIGGDTRSGSTILSQILGSYDRCLAVGELYDFWVESLSGDRICSCGAPLRQCEFWTTVMEKAFGGSDPTTIQHVIELRRSVQSIYHLPLILFPRLRPNAFDRRLREYAAILEQLYTTIQEVSGCEAIIDSSKLAAYALALAGSPKIDVSLVHIFRDSRACVFSWRRLKRDPAAGDKPRYLPQRPLLQTALVWTIRNMIVSSIAERFPVSVRLRYEDLVRAPRATMGAVAARLGLSGQERLWLSDDEVLVSASNHIFVGNPGRVEHGRIQIRSDDEWRTRMSPWDQRLVFALTLPALWRLGYLGSPGSTLEAITPERSEQMVGELHR